MFPTHPRVAVLFLSVLSAFGFTGVIVSARSAAPAKSDAKPGRLIFTREGRIASIRPDGEDLVLHTDEWQPGRPELSTLLRLSPDGRRVAYGLVAGVKGGIPVSEFTAVHVRGLDPAGADIDLGVKGVSWCWSPDGTRLAVGSVERTGDTPATRNWLVDVKTKKKVELKLPADRLVIDWSADGDWLLTVRGPEAPGQPRVDRVSLMKMDGSGAHDLADGKRDTFDARFAPDGRQVLFTTFDYHTRKSRIYVTGRTGGAPRQVSPDLNAQVQGVCWSPDGKRIASVWRQNYVKPGRGEKAEYFLMVTDNDGRSRVTLRKETGKMPADETAAFQMNWITLSGLDWR